MGYIRRRINNIDISLKKYPAAENHGLVLSIIELAHRVKGIVAGNFDEGMKVTGTCAIDSYVENKVSFVKNGKYERFLAPLHNAIVLLPKNLAYCSEKYPRNTYIIVNNVDNAIIDLQDFFYISEFLITEKGISLTAKIHSTARIGKDVFIGENVYVGKNVVIGDTVKILHNSCIFDDVTIGNGTHIHTAVCLHRKCQIGNNCIIHSGVCVGDEGFRFEQDIEQKTVRKMLNVGRVIIGDRVEIGANSTIERATFSNDATILFDDVKLDPLCHIGHNVKIGARSIVAQSGIGGSTIVGEDVWIGTGVTISNNLNIGNRAKILLNAVVAYDVSEGEMVSGFYAMPHKQWKRIYNKLKGENGNTIVSD